jgi:hypothetical protein
LAEVVAGRLVRLENGRSRSELLTHLIEQGHRQPNLIVGLDFAFSLPAWYLRQQGLSGVRELWALAANQCETWLSGTCAPFWGRAGSKRPDAIEHFRRTELEVPQVSGIRPKSAFQIAGAGAVGTGSLRGMPILLKLAEAGFSIWPFDESGWPRVVEIYPRLLTREVAKSDPRATDAYLARQYPNMEAGFRRTAAASEDAFDAAVSALRMSEHLDELRSLRRAKDENTLLEGMIWTPRLSAASSPGAT